MSASTAATTLTVGDPIPYVLTLRQLAGLLQISERALLELRKAGTHRGVKQLDAPGDPRFCGRTFKRWLDDAAGAPSGRQFFGGAQSRQRHAQHPRAAQPALSMTSSGMTAKGLR